MQSQVELLRLKDTDLTVLAPEQDIRGRTVIDFAGEEVGKVETLLIDSVDKHVRFMELSEAVKRQGIKVRQGTIPPKQTKQPDASYQSPATGC